MKMLKLFIINLVLCSVIAYFIDRFFGRNDLSGYLFIAFCSAVGSTAASFMFSKKS